MKRNLRKTIAAGMAHGLIALSGLVTFTGCVALPLTDKVLELADEDRTTPARSANIWALSGVRSALKQSNGDMAVCAEFADSYDSKPKPYTITLSGEAPFGNMPGRLKPDPKDAEAPLAPGINPVSAPVSYYLYPLNFAREGCECADTADDGGAASVKVERVVTHRQDLVRWLTDSDMLDTLSDRIVEVSFVTHATVSMRNPDPVGDADAVKPAFRDILLIYAPAKKDDVGLRTIGIAGGYGKPDRLINPYYLLTPATITGDLLLNYVGLYFGVMAPPNYRSNAVKRLSESISPADDSAMDSRNVPAGSQGP